MSIGDEYPQLMSYSPGITNTGNAGDWLDKLKAYEELRVQHVNQNNIFQGLLGKAEEKKMPEIKKTTYRVVRVFIVDPDEKVPLDKAVLLKGEEQLTNLTDEELFLEIGIKPLLDKHNDTRKFLVDKKASERAGKEVCLEPIRIRDLKMVVSCIAEF